MIQPALITEAPKVVEFSMAGVPLCQGSKIALVSGKRVRKGKDVWVKNPIASMVDQADRKTETRPKGSLTRWKARIAAKADALMRGDLIGPVHLWRGAVVLECEFVLPRRDSHYTPVGGVLRKGAPTIPAGDLDKMIRAVGDALSRVVYRDDVQIRRIVSTKRFASKLSAVGGVFVKVTAL